MSHLYKIPIEIDGHVVEKTFNGWHEYSGIHTDTLRRRYYAGWRGIKLLEIPKRYARKERPKEPERYISEFMHRRWVSDTRENI